MHLPQLLSLAFLSSCFLPVLSIPVFPVLCSLQASLPVHCLLGFVLGPASLSFYVGRENHFTCIILTFKDSSSKLSWAQYLSNCLLSLSLLFLSRLNSGPYKWEVYALSLSLSSSPDSHFSQKIPKIFGTSSQNCIINFSLSCISPFCIIYLVKGISSYLIIETRNLGSTWPLLFTSHL